MFRGGAKEHVQVRFGVQKLPVFCEQWSELEQTWQVDRVTDIITDSLLYFWEIQNQGVIKGGFHFHYAYVLSSINIPELK